MDKIRQALIKLIHESVPDASLAGEVVSVNETKFTCDVKPADGSPDYHDVRLKSSVDNNDSGLICIPVVGSFVIISGLQKNKHAYFVSRFSEIKRYLIKVEGGATIEMKPTGEVIMNQGVKGGIPVISVLQAELNRIEANYNLLRTSTATAISALSSIIDGGSSASVFNSAMLAVTPQNINGLENTKVKHG